MSEHDVRASSAAFPGEVLLVENATLSERMNAPYALTVSVRVPGEDVDVSVLLGQDFALEIERLGVTRRLAGIVQDVRFGETEFRRFDQHTAAEVVVVPALALLRLRTDTRIFQDMTVIEILESVLGDSLSPFSRSIDVRADGTYPKREYCLQYQESDFAFVSRLMEEEGLGYSFDHEGETEVLVITDANAQFGEVALSSSDSLVRFREGDLVRDDIEPVRRFSRRSRSVTTSVVVRDYDFTGSTTREGEARGEDAAGRDREHYEHGLGGQATIGGYSGTAYGAEDTGRVAQIRQEAYAMEATTFEGEGRVAGFTPGQVFELADHPLGMDGRYVLLAVEHRLTDHGQGIAYESFFRCISADVPYRPMRVTPKPATPSVESAVVVGPGGDEIFTDEHGRVKVQFSWDRVGGSDDHSSCFVRVRQAWAGKEWGFVFIPRIGMEVIVTFVDGDPDRPLVSGCVYNGSHAPPYGLPGEKTKSTIKTQSSPNKPDGFNELRFEDKAGSEEIFTHAEKDQNEKVLANHTTWVGGNQENHVKKAQHQEIHKNQTEHVILHQKMVVHGKRDVTVNGHFKEKITGGEVRKVTGPVHETIGDFEIRNIGGGHKDEITGGETRTIDTKLDETITGTHRQTVVGASSETIASGSTQNITAGPAKYETTKFKFKSGGPVTFNGIGTQVYFNAPVREEDWTVKIGLDPVFDYGGIGEEKYVPLGIDVWVARSASMGVQLSCIGIKIGIVGWATEVVGFKGGAGALKVDIYGYKDEKSLRVSPFEFCFTT